MGVIVEDGIVCVGTPICVHNKEVSTLFQFEILPLSDYSVPNFECC